MSKLKFYLIFALFLSSIYAFAQNAETKPEPKYRSILEVGAAIQWGNFNRINELSQTYTTYAKVSNFNYQFNLSHFLHHTQKNFFFKADYFAFTQPNQKQDQTVVKVYGLGNILNIGQYIIRKPKQELAIYFGLGYIATSLRMVNDLSPTFSFYNFVVGQNRSLEVWQQASVFSMGTTFKYIPTSENPKKSYLGFTLGYGVPLDGTIWKHEGTLLAGSPNVNPLGAFFRLSVGNF